MGFDIGRAAVSIILFLLCLTVHEAAHALVAAWKGDNTARDMGRLTLNPFPHIDIFGTILIPLVGILSNFPIFGWAKPVPVDPRNLQDPKKDMLWISLAGPASNFIFAILLTILLFAYFSIFRNSAFSAHAPILHIIKTMVLINCVLGLFNLIPIAPLDGWKILVGVLPVRTASKLVGFEQYGFYVLLFLMITGLFRYFAVVPHWLTNKMFQIGSFVFF